MYSVSFTQGAVRGMRQPLEGFGLVRVGPLGCEGLGQDCRGRSCHRALGPGEVQDDDEPEECE
jgi:hypothetical protein